MPKKLRPSQLAAALFWMAIAMIVLAVLLWLSLHGVIR
jgi:hypothetical protein